MEQPKAKKLYAAPKVQEVGEVQAMTLGNSTGNFLDQSFPNTTPKDQLTFSG
jgi:hypothetical protein